MRISEDGVTLVLFTQHKDRHELQKSPSLQQAHLQSEHLHVSPQVPQPTKCSPYFNFLVEGNLLGEFTVGFSSTNAIE